MAKNKKKVKRLQEVIRQVKPSVVAVSNYREGGPRGITFDILGSGFNIHPSGLIVTNEHVLRAYLQKYSTWRMQDVGEPAPPPPEMKIDNMKVLFYSIVKHPTLGRTIAALPATLRKTIASYKHDFALLKVELTQLNPKPFLELADSGHVQEGDEIFVCGFPYGEMLHDATAGVHHTITRGIVSAIVPFAGVPSEYIKAFQLDLMLNPGNSGGPVLLANTGKVVGVATSTFMPAQRGGVEIPSGISYALPINVIKPYIDQLEKITEEDIRTGDFSKLELTNVAFDG